MLEAYIYKIHTPEEVFDYRIDAGSREEADVKFFEIFDRQPAEGEYQRRDRF